ncbi:L-glyceraldehyde 3-phosphate reductase [Arachnia propionica]|uniref:L-glyceraldehyde 3-phosphate reductase n=1 Tax=Arachnia propionica TaxID=1750 RepID=A0A3P1WQH7_9ACTN|nr:L-glyceraldehyde 3-phosphate reductase [Arachnia propionica]RRD48844.1 L-glyceraldehyde 3-phosphate reductase [Arachnia propionica]
MYPTYVPDQNRYDGRMPYRFCGRSGLKLPVLSLGMWQNFGDDKPLGVQREIIRRAFDAGITHFDLANNYGPPYGQAEINFGTIFRQDLAPFRDEIIISSKAGYDMWPGPYGEGGGSRKYVLASLDQSLKRIGVDYVDIFYSHRFDPDTPIAETMMALDQAVRSGKALYVGISSYDATQTRQAAQIARELGTPLLIHQPLYSMFNRWIEPGVKDACETEGMGIISFSALAQGLLTNRYLDGVPSDSRAAREGSLKSAQITGDVLERLRALGAIAERRGQTLSQLALAWVLRDPRVTSTLIGVSSLEQLETNLGTLKELDFTDDELAEIDQHIAAPGGDIWE